MCESPESATVAAKGEEKKRHSRTLASSVGIWMMGLDRRSLDLSIDVIAVSSGGGGGPSGRKKTATNAR